MSALLVPSLSWCLVHEAAAQGPACDSGLRATTQSPYAYGPRGDRCEGVYVKQVGGTVLAFASLTSAFESYDPGTVQNLHVTWSAAADSGLRIRVRGIRPNLYYAMDVDRPADATRYEWPAAILSSLRIAQRDIGALAWTRRRIGGAWRKVYVPLRITGTVDSAVPQRYQLVLFPGVKLEEVYVTLSRSGENGQPAPGELLKNHEAQDQGYYPAERAIRILLPALSSPGLYYLEVSATLPGGNPVAIEPILIDASTKEQTLAEPTRSATP